MMHCIVCKKQLTTSSNISSFQFPTNSVMRKKWLDALRISDSFEINGDDVRVCEDHFDPKNLSCNVKNQGKLSNNKNNKNTKWLSYDAVPFLSSWRAVATASPSSSSHEDDEESKQHRRYEEGVTNMSKQSCSSMATSSDLVVEIHWEQHKDVLCEQLWKAFQQEHLVDTDVGCRVSPSSERSDGLKAHRVVLAALMPMAFDNGSSTYDFVCGGHAINFRALIEFAYTGQVAVPVERLDSLQQLAENLHFDGLADAIERQRQGKSTCGSMEALIEEDVKDHRPLSIKEEPLEESVTDECLSIEMEISHLDPHEIISTVKIKEESGNVDTEPAEAYAISPVVSMIIKENPLDVDDLDPNNRRRPPTPLLRKLLLSDVNPAVATKKRRDSILRPEALKPQHSLRTCQYQTREQGHTYARKKTRRSECATSKSPSQGLSTQDGCANPDTIRPYACNTCHRTFEKQFYLDLHHQHNPTCKKCYVRVRTWSRMSMVCQLCGVFFASQLAKQKHLLEKHYLESKQLTDYLEERRRRYRFAINSGSVVETTRNVPESIITSDLKDDEI